MDNITMAVLALLGLGMLGLTIAVVWLGTKAGRADPRVAEQLAGLAGKVEAMEGHMSSSLQSVATQVGVFGEVKESLGKVTEATNRVLQFGEDVRSLQEILQSPLHRGGFGEILLANLLAQIMPTKYYELQHTFRNNTRVDAVLFLGERILPIDSKFSLEGYETEHDGQSKSKAAFVRAVKQRIEESTKYILPAEQTFEFVMMYIPAESVYYEIVTNSDLFYYAMQRRVIPVSPNSLIAYLQVIVFGLRGMQIEENAKQILGQISTLKMSLETVQSAYEKLGLNIAQAQAKHGELGKKLDKFGTQFEQLAGDALPTQAAGSLQDSGSLIHKPGEE